MIWRACERFSLRPPGVNVDFEKNSPWSQAKLFAYEQIRQVERNYELEALAGVKMK